MTNRDIMRSALKKHTITVLSQYGFSGKYPHYRRENDYCVDLVSFQTNKYGGSFSVEVSAVFPDSENANYCSYDKKSRETFMIDGTNERYRLPGMFDGWFYYQDVYLKRSLLFGKIYYPVREKEVLTFVAPKGYHLVHKFDEMTAIQMCEEVNRQLVKGFEWLENMKKKRKKGESS